MPHTLIMVEPDGACARRASLGAVALARRLGGPYALGVLGSGVAAVAESVRGFGASAVLTADDPALAEPLADRCAAVVAQMADRLGADTILGTTSTLTKDVLPRVAALLDAAMLTDVIAVETKDGETLFHRLLSAGSLHATVSLEGPRRVLTARGAAFPPPEPGGAPSPVQRFEFDASALPAASKFLSRERPAAVRPDLGEARVIVAGGRPLKDKDTFERLIGGLADALGGAVGATRAAVDAGMAGNQYQIGQTARTVAPELYIAVGISGAIQHVAGIMDSKVIVAINRDPDAPIFQVATYGLVGDLHQIVPRLIEAFRS